MLCLQMGLRYKILNGSCKAGKHGKLRQEVFAFVDLLNREELGMK